MNKRLALATVWLIGVVAVVGYSFAPDHYLLAKLGNSEPPAYPTRGVLWILFAVTLQVCAVWGIVRPNSYRFSWGRALAALVLVGAMTVYFGMWMMHAPPYQVAHFLWSGAQFVGLFVVLVVSAIGAIRSRANDA